MEQPPPHFDSQIIVHQIVSGIEGAKPILARDKDGGLPLLAKGLEKKTPFGERAPVQAVAQGLERFRAGKILVKTADVNDKIIPTSLASLSRNCLDFCQVRF